MDGAFLEGNMFVSLLLIVLPLWPSAHYNYLLQLQHFLSVSIPSEGKSLWISTDINVLHLKNLIKFHRFHSLHLVDTTGIVILKHPTC